jgi:hypothetical protein
MAQLGRGQALAAQGRFEQALAPLEQVVFS